MPYDDYYAFRVIAENPIILDFRDCKYADDIHLLLKNKFGFPDYYGMNWDACWDCIDGLFYKRGDFIIEIHNFNSLNKELKEYCQPMLDIFKEVQKNESNVFFSYIS